MIKQAAKKLTRSLRIMRVAGTAFGIVLGVVFAVALTRDQRLVPDGAGEQGPGGFWMMVILFVTLYTAFWIGLYFSTRALRRGIVVSDRLIGKLAASRQALELAQELGRTGSWTADLGGQLDWTPQGARLLGLPPTRTSTTLGEFRAMVHPDDLPGVLAQYRRVVATRLPFVHDFRVVPPDGNVRWLAARGAVSSDGCRLAGTVVDVTEQKRAQSNFRNLFEFNPLPFWVFDVDTLRFLEVNRAAVRQYGYSREEFLGMTILDIRPPEYLEEVLADVRDTSAPKWASVRTWQHRRKDGSTLDAKIHASDIQFQGRTARLILAEDMTETLSYQRELAFRASHDAVTGLPNSESLADTMESCRKSGCRIACVQLHGLELIEDSLGMQPAHEVLRAVAARLAVLGERYGLAGHIRGEEFALVVCEVSRWDEALVDLDAELARPVARRDSLQQLDYWIGSARFPDDGHEPVQAISHACLAAHVARNEHIPIAYFTPQMTQQASNRLDMAARIHRAIEHDEFELHFQKIARLDDGLPVGFEALLRWPQGDGNAIDPAEFIRISEDSGLIVPLGLWVLHQAASAQRRLSDAGHPGLSIAVNVSQAQFLKRDLAADFDAVSSEFGLRRGALNVELTETMLMTRPERALATLHRLRERGIRVSLDDFGTGFSSMAYLRDLPIDALKMDQSFVHGVHRDGHNAAICHALLTLGHSMGLTVVAEGVEEFGEHEWLKQHRCDRVQGYYVGRPSPLEAVMASL